MSQETEHRFLVRSEAWRQAAGAGTQIRQGYLSTAADRNVRIRLANGDAKLTVKGKAKGLTRSEFEYAVPSEDGEQIERLCRKPVLEKVRYRIEQGDVTWEIDEYSGENRGLVIAEVETKRRLKKLPPWIGPEISTDERYRNYSLVDRPFATWEKDAPKPETKYALKRGEPLGKAFFRILKEQVETAQNELAIRGGKAESAVHEARKCVKRARAAWRLLRGAVPQLFDETNRQLQLAGRKLSKLRDAEALLETLDDLVEDRRAQALLTRRKQRINDSDQTGRDFRLAMTELRKTMRSLEKLTLDRLEFPVVAAAVERTISRGKHAYEQAYAEPSSERFHELRKRSKDLRYQLALLSPVWPEVLQGYSDTAKKLEQHLGEDHNLAVLIEVVPKLKDAATKKQASLRQKSEIIAGRLYAEPVKVWAARLRVAWEGFDNR